MVDTFTPSERSRIMRAVKSKNTTPELVVRSVLHRMGYRFSLHRDDLPGKPDIVMPARRTAIFVHGCYWHLHACKEGRSTPATNVEYWSAKRNRTRLRDRRHLAAMRRAGWRVIVVWECQTKNRERLAATLRQRIQQSRPPLPA